MTQPIDLNISTSREVFDFVSKHLTKQGRRAYSQEMNMCLYRKEGGDSCAGGCLIPDSIYSPRMEGSDLYTLMSGEFGEALVAAGFQKHERLLYALQAVHDLSDNWLSPQALQSALEKASNEYGVGLCTQAS